MAALMRGDANGSGSSSLACSSSWLPGLLLLLLPSSLLTDGGDVLVPVLEGVCWWLAWLWLALVVVVLGCA